MTSSQQENAEFLGEPKQDPTTLTSNTPHEHNPEETDLQDSASQASSDTSKHRPIKSYVLRTGRLTSSQNDAIEQYFPQYGITLAQLQANPDLTSYFGDEKPVVLEIGFGMGVSLVEMAKNNPANNYLGIEVHTPGVGNILKLMVAEGVTNLRVIQHDAIEILQTLQPNAIAGLQLYFPDPWHKTRHHKRRIVNPNFLNLVLGVMVQGGFIHMATDWENYAEHMLEVLQADDRIVNTSVDNTYVPRPEQRPLTKFEQRGHRLGHGVWDLYFLKK